MSFQMVSTSSQTAPARLTVPLTAIDTAGLPPPRDYFDGMAFELWEPKPVLTAPIASSETKPADTIKVEVLLSSDEDGVKEIPPPVISKTSTKKIAKNHCHLCEKDVFKIYRHLKITHGLQGKALEDERKACRSALIKKRRANNNPGTIRNPPKMCQVNGCGEIVPRLDRHLASKHGIIKKNDPESYKKAFKEAKTWWVLNKYLLQSKPQTLTFVIFYFIG